MKMRGVLILFYFLCVQAAFAQVVSSTFDVNADGWQMHNNAGGYLDPATYSTTSGNPGGAISCPTAISFPYEYFQAPAKFLTNLSASYNQTVTFDLLVNTAGNDGSSADFLLSGGGYVRFYYVFPTKPTANVWTSYSITLSEADPNWHYYTIGGAAPTRQQWKQVLSNVQQFEIRSRFLAGSAGGYSSTLDNVKVNTTTFQTPPNITAISPAVGIPNVTTVTITGTNFNPATAQNVVLFGGIKATALSASATQITAKVPFGAQFGRITVVDISTGLQTQSLTNFSPQFNNNSDFGGRIIPQSLNPFINLPLDATSTGNVSFQAADVDGDGWLDVVIGEPGKKQFSIYQNVQNSGTITTASFGAKLSFPTGFGSAQGSVFLSDLDGDGKLDVIMGSEGTTAQIGIFRNTSTAGVISFAPVQFITAVSYADGPLSAADLDGDGRPEILSTWSNSAGAGVAYFSIFQNLSSPGNIDFTYYMDMTTGTSNGPFTIISTGDIDNDGKIDVAMSSAFEQAFNVYRNSSSAKGSFSFDAALVMDTGGNPHNVVIADLDNDGKLDLAYNGYNTSNILVMKNISSPGSLTAASFATPVTLTSGVFTNSGRTGVGDLNGDSKPDLIVGGAQNIAVFENNTTAGTINANSFLTGSAYAGNGTAPYGTPIVADFNNDGKLDIAINQNGGAAPNNIAIFQNNCYPAPQISGVTPASAAAGANVTLNGSLMKTGLTAPTPIVRVGAVLASSSLTSMTATSATVPVGAKSDRWSLSEHGLTTLSPVYPVTFPTSRVIDATSLATPVTFTLSSDVQNTVMVADFDDDGKIDVGVTDNYHTGKIFHNTQATAGQPITTSSLTQITTTFSNYISMAAVDIDGDGKLDVTSGYNVYRNKSTPGTITFDPAISSSSNFSVAALADFNKDGKIDFATISNTTSLTLYQNNSTSGAFIPNGVLSSMASTGISFVRPTGVTYGAMVTADIDSDGNDDLVTANPGANSWSYYKNLNVKGSISATSFAARVDIATGINPSGIAASDFDGDGLVDIAISQYGEVFVSVYRNTTSGGVISFAAPIKFTVVTKGYDLVSQDMDGDGKAEIVIIHQGVSSGGSLTLLQNTSTAGAIAFGAAVNFPSTHKPIELAVADINQDNKPDVVVAADVLMIYENIIAGQLLTVTVQPVNTAICANATGTITTTATGTTNITYQWQKSAISPVSFADITNGAGYTGAATASLSIDATVATTADQFVYRSKISGDATAPLFTNTVNVVINTVPSAPTVGDQMVCEGAAATFTASGGSDGQYRWYNTSSGGTAIVNETHPSFTTGGIASATTYYVSIFNGSCESDRAAAVATVSSSCNPTGSAPVIASGSGSTGEGGEATVDISSLISDPDGNIDLTTLAVLVQPASGAVATISNGNLIVDYTGLTFTGADPLTIRVCDKTGNCSSQIIVIYVGVSEELLVYNGISPDGNQLNDKWIILGIDILPDTKTNHVDLFNRWGDKVFEVDNYDNNIRVFTGSSTGGSQLPSGTYYYKIAFVNSSRKALAGYLTLKR